MLLHVSGGRIRGKSARSVVRHMTHRQQSLLSLAAREMNPANSTVASSANAEAAAEAAAETPTIDSNWKPTFFAPALTPLQFLIVSSPSQKKVVYTQLRNFKTSYGRTWPLIDSGLAEPAGIAFDRDRGHLYVADRGAQRIYRYSILVGEYDDRDGVKQYSLKTDGNRLTIIDGHQVDWVTVNANGDVFFSDIGTNSINKITTETMQYLGDGLYTAAQLTVLSEKEQEAMSASQTATELSPDTNAVPTDPPLPAARMLSMYEGSINPHVSTPAGLVSDGLHLYWTNAANGNTAGSAMRGDANPKSPPMLAGGSDPAPFPTTVLSNTTEVGYGVAKSNTMVFFSGTDYTKTPSGAGVVFGVNIDGGPTMNFAEGLSKPRGLCWDGDNTIFVADQDQNAVWSFPVGRMMESAPLTKAVELLDAYGIAMLTAEDAAFQHKDSARGLHASGILWSVLASMIAAFACRVA